MGNNIMSKFIKWSELDFKKSKGQEKLRCPECDEIRSDKKDKSLLINHNDGYGKCFYCEALTFKESNEFEQKEFTLPSQEWRNHTNLSDGLVKYLQGRGISQNTAIALNITEEKQYMHRIEKESNCIVFNYFEGEKLVSKKYRDGNKNFTQSKGSKNIFYNINSIIGSETCYIVEGEMDVLSLYEIGVKNVISVPNGANDNDAHWIASKRYLDGIKRFIIATDNDTKGIELRDKIAQRLGRYRCTFIEFKGKDANDDLISLDLEQSIKSEKRFPVSGTYSVDSLFPKIMDIYHNGLPETLAPKHKCFGDLKNVFSVMRGQLTTITGIPSHGKSNFNDWYVLNLIKDYNMKGSWFSPEHTPMELYQSNLIEKVTGKTFYNKKYGTRITEEGLNEYREWANEKIYLTACDGGQLPTWDWLLETFKEQMFNYGIDIFVIDAFNKVMLPKGNKLDAINEVLTKLTHFAQMNNVCVFLVAHPTKMQKNEEGIYNIPDLYSVSGSADFRNQTHNGYTIYRYFDGHDKKGNQIFACTKFINTKTKFSFQGEIGGGTEFQFCMANGRYYANGIEPTFNMCHRINTDEIEIPQPIAHDPNSHNNDDDFEDLTPF